MVEVLVATAILAIIGLALFAGFSGSGRLMRRVSSSLRTSSQILRLDDALRRELAQIRVPFWVGLPPGRDEQGRLVLPYLNGDAAGTLTVRFEKGAIELIRTGGTQKAETPPAAVETEMTVGTFGPFESVEWQPAAAPESGLRGIEFIISPRKSLRSGEGAQDAARPPASADERVRLFVAFGAHPFYLGDAAE